MPLFRIRRDKTESIDVEAATEAEAIQFAENDNWEANDTYGCSDGQGEYDVEEIQPGE